MARSLKKIGLGMLALAAVGSFATVASATISPDGTVTISVSSDGSTVV